MKGWQFSYHNHCFRYYICWSQVSRKLPDNYAVKQLLQQLVEGVHRLACGHSTDKYYSVDRVPWQGHQLAYRQCTVKSEPHYSTSTAIPLTVLCNNFSMLSECTGELSVLYSFFHIQLSPTVLKTVMTSVVRKAVTRIGCLKKLLAAYHDLLRHDTILLGTLTTHTAPEDRKHMLMWKATQHLADCSEYRTMNVTW